MVQLETDEDDDNSEYEDSLDLSLMLQSNGFQMNDQDKLLQLKKDWTSSTVLNKDLTSMEREIYEAIKYSDVEKLTLLGADS